MRRPGTTLATLLALGALAAPAHAQLTPLAAPAAGSTTIDFDGLPDGTDLTTQFAAQGVTVSGYACASSFYAGFFAGDPIQVTNAQVGTCPGVGFSGTAGALTFTFSSPTTTFGFNGATNAGDVITFATAHGSLALPAALFVNPFVGFTDATPFTSVTVSVGPVHPAILFDNLSFGAASTVPEPATLGLVALGLVGLAAGTRRRRRATA